MISSIYMSV